jgi:hypothetical protein
MDYVRDGRKLFESFLLAFKNFNFSETLILVSKFY